MRLEIYVVSILLYYISSTIKGRKIRKKSTESYNRVILREQYLIQLTNWIEHFSSVCILFL